jgi:hypothetical protein
MTTKPDNAALMAAVEAGFSQLTTGMLDVNNQEGTDEPKPMEET